MAVTIYDRDREMLAVNVRGSYFHIAYYKPGPWEGSFGVDWEGDHQLHAWGDPPSSTERSLVSTQVPNGPLPVALRRR
jgi:hypothetical protein